VLLLQAKGDGRASQVRQQGLEMLRQQAVGITDTAERTVFLDEIESHRSLSALPIRTSTKIC
jgi:hypothetical protein